jgi:hypothetical protein
MTETEKKLRASARARAWYANNKERAKNNYKAWSKKNSLELKESQKEWRGNHKEHLRNYHRNWMRAHKLSEQAFPLDLVSWLDTFLVDTSLLEGFPCLLDKNLGLGIVYCQLARSVETEPWNRVGCFHNKLRKKGLSKGVRIFTMFEDEWLHRQGQVKNFLKATLSREGTNIAARKCDLREVPVDVSRAFIEKYHIQGEHWGAIFGTGAFYEEDLVGVMTLSRHHRDASQTILDRLCFKDGVNVQGGSSRLFSRCLEYCRVNQIPKLVSWSDNRWSTGRVYEALGFTLEEELGPAYSYVKLSDPTYRISKQSQQKKLTKCPEGMTEREWSLQNGLHRIWDCGKKKWVKEIV